MLLFCVFSLCSFLIMFSTVKASRRGVTCLQKFREFLQNLWHYLLTFITLARALCSNYYHIIARTTGLSRGKVLKVHTTLLTINNKKSKGRSPLYVGWFIRKNTKASKNSGRCGKWLDSNKTKVLSKFCLIIQKSTPKKSDSQRQNHFSHQCTGWSRMINKVLFTYLLKLSSFCSL